MCDNDIDPYRGYTKQQADKLRAMMCNDGITSTAESEAIDPPPAPEYATASFGGDAQKKPTP